MIALTIHGLALQDPLSVAIEPRSLLVGPNESGKSTILNALRAVASGEASLEGIGNVPGALLALAAPNRVLTIDAEVDGVGVRAEIAKKGQTKISTLDGFDCRFAHVALKGSAEDIRKFLASNVRPPAEWTRNRVGQTLVSKFRRQVDVPPGASIIDSVTTMLKNAKEESSRLRKNMKQLEATAQGAALTAAQLTVDGAATLGELETARAEWQAKLVAANGRLDELDGEISRWNAAQTAAKNARERYDALRVAKPAPVDVPAIEAQVNDQQGKTVEATERLETLTTKETQEKEGFDAAGHELAEAQRKHEEAVGHLGIAEQGSCHFCGQAVSKERLGQIREEVAVARAAAADAEKKIADARERYRIATNEADLADGVADAEARRLAFLESQLSDAKNAAEAASTYDARLAELAKASKETIDAITGMLPPPSTQALEGERNVATAEIAKLDDRIIDAKARANSRAYAASTREKVGKAEAEFKANEEMVEAIRAIRNEIVRDSVGPLEIALKSIAGALRGVPIVDLGDEENDPKIGIVRDEGVVPFAVLSAGARATFLGGLAAALLEQSKAPEANRILLIEAGEIDVDTLKALCAVLRDARVGHIAIATHAAARFVPYARKLAIDWGWSTPEWRALPASVQA